MTVGNDQFLPKIDFLGIYRVFLLSELRPLGNQAMLILFIPAAPLFEQDIVRLKSLKPVFTILLLAYPNAT